MKFKIQNLLQLQEKRNFDGIDINEILIDYNRLESSEPLNIGIFDCFFNSLSLESIPAFNLSARAKKSMSFGCSESKLNASGILSEYFEKDTNSKTLVNFSLNSMNSLEDNFVLSKISFLCFSNSSKANSGEYKSWPVKSNFLISEPLQKNENNLFVSITSFIYKNPLDLSSFNLFCFANSPNLFESSSLNSLAVRFDSRNSANSILSSILLTTLFNMKNQSISGCVSIFFLNSLDINSIIKKNIKRYLNLSEF